MVVAAYGLILPQAVLDAPRHGCVNVHASLLPRWRGAAPIQAAILSGDATTGISLMSMTAGLDCGPVYATEAVTIGAGETAGELHDRLAELGGCLLVAHLDDLLNGRIDAVEQDEASATYAGKIDKSDAQLDWRQDAGQLHRCVRAYNPVPGAFFFAPGNDGPLRIKCWRSSVVDEVDASPGQVVECDRGGIIVACGSGGLRLEELQLPGKKRVSAREFADQLDLRGRALD